MNHNFPQSLLNQINEHSAGGYMLIRMNDVGEIDLHLQFDSLNNRFAITRYAEAIVLQLKQFEHENISKSVAEKVAISEEKKPWFGENPDIESWSDDPIDEDPLEDDDIL